MEDSYDDDIKPSIPIPRSVTLVDSFQRSSVGPRREVVDSKPSWDFHKRSSSVRKANEHVLQNEPQSSTTPWTWKVTNVIPVPMFYPLERTAVVVKGISLEEITGRISSFMRLNSISCTPCNDFARLDCLTRCLLKFSLQLWRGNTSNSQGVENDLHFIVEISRLQGCAIEMQRLRNWLVFTITTGEQPRTPLDHGMGSRCPSRMLEDMYEQQMRFNRDDDIDHDGYAENDESKEALDICVTLLESNNLDQNRLGIESLCAMTAPTNFSEDNLDWISEALVYGAGECGTKLQSLVSAYFQQIERPSDNAGNSSYEQEDESGFFKYSRGCTFGVMHNCCLQALKNSLERLVLRKIDLDEASLDFNGEFWQSVLPALMYDVQIASSRPHEASLAAKCLGYLEKLDSTALNHYKKEGLLPLAVTAHEYGKIYHFTLERASETLINSLST